MNLEPNDLMLFARVVEEGSFSRAAERSGSPAIARESLSEAVCPAERRPAWISIMAVITSLDTSE